MNTSTTCGWSAVWAFAVSYCHVDQPMLYTSGARGLRGKPSQKAKAKFDRLLGRTLSRKHKRRAAEIMALMARK